MTNTIKPETIKKIAIALGEKWKIKQQYEDNFSLSSPEVQMMMAECLLEHNWEIKKEGDFYTVWNSGRVGHSVDKSLSACIIAAMERQIGIKEK